MTESTLEQTYLQDLKNLAVSLPEQQVQFHPDRKWRIDFMWPKQGLAVEINGGTWGGGHSRGAAVAKEYEKLNTLNLWGYRVLVFDTVMVNDGTAGEVTRAALALTYIRPPSYLIGQKKKRTKEKKVYSTRPTRLSN